MTFIGVSKGNVQSLNPSPHLKCVKKLLLLKFIRFITKIEQTHNFIWLIFHMSLEF